MSAFSSAIPWRKAGFWYKNNEVYFDIVETLDAVVNNILGKIDVIFKLSGHHPYPYQFTHHHRAFVPPLCQLDACLCHYVPYNDRTTSDSLNHFRQSKALSLVPLDGRFTSMEYRIDPSMSKSGAAPALTAAAAVQHQIQVPFTLRAALSTNDHGGTFELTFVPLVATLVDVAVELYLGGGASGAMHNNRRRGMDVPARAAHAAVVALRDGLGLQGTFASADAHPWPARGAQVSFAMLAGALLRGLRVHQPKISGETYKPFKGVRGRAFGRVEWRVEWKGSN